MIDKVTQPDIQDKVTTGAAAAELINDSKRAINQIVDGKEGSLGNPTQDDMVLSSSSEGERGWVEQAKVYTLTSEDINDATPTTGVVSGEQLAELAGGTVLKDWTTITNTTTPLNLLEGITLPEDSMNGLSIEIEDFKIDNPYSPSNFFLGIIPRRTGNSEAGVKHNAYATRISSSTGGSYKSTYALNDTRNMILDSPEGVLRSSVILDLKVHSIRDSTILRESVGMFWRSETYSLLARTNSAATTQVEGVFNAFAVAASAAQTMFTELWLDPTASNGEDFVIDSFRYRVTHKK